MEAADVSRAVAAARSIAATLGLQADDATVLCNSNKLAVRLLPCAVVARVAHVGQEVAEQEVALARALAAQGGPVAALVAPSVQVRDGFAVTLWTYYEQAPSRMLAPSDYAAALERLHAGMRTLHLATPHAMDRVEEARQIVETCGDHPAFAPGDRERVRGRLDRAHQTIAERADADQVLHGEPHPGNVLTTEDGPVFIDLETCCRGPVEFDLAHVPRAVADCYPGADPHLLGESRALVLAMVAAWRLEPGDQLPNGERALQDLLRALRDGPPWPTLDDL